MMQIEKICTDFIFLLKNLATNSLINLYQLVNSWLKFYLNICVQKVGKSTVFLAELIQSLFFLFPVGRKYRHPNPIRNRIRDGKKRRNQNFFIAVQSIV